MGESSYILIRRGCRVDCAMKGIWRRRFYPLPPRAYQLLMYFVAHANSVVTEEDLIRIGWPERGVSRANLYPYIHQLRQGIESNPRHPRWLVTHRGQGYCLRMKTGHDPRTRPASAP
jgi:DNA-binding winged helix-turn-helix (wHTH) protein